MTQPGNPYVNQPGAGNLIPAQNSAQATSAAQASANAAQGFYQNLVQHPFSNGKLADALPNAGAPQIVNQVPYQDYQKQSVAAQNYGQAAGNQLNSLPVLQSLGQLQQASQPTGMQLASGTQGMNAVGLLNQAALGRAPGMDTLSQNAQGSGPGAMAGLQLSAAGQGAGMSSLQQNAMGGGPGAMGLLAASANGQGPNPGAIAAQQGQQAAQAFAASQAASARGGFGVGSAQKAAMQTGAAMGQQNTQAAALAAAQQQLASQQQYAQAQGQAQGTLAGAVGQAQGTYAGAQGAAQGTYQNAINSGLQGYAGQANNLYQNATGQAAQGVAGAAQYNGAAMGNQMANLNYGLSQQQFYQQQADEAAQLAGNQANVDINQSAQTVQQNIANNQLMQGYVGAGAGLIGAGFTGGASLLATPK